MKIVIIYAICVWFIAVHSSAQPVNDANNFVVNAGAYEQAFYGIFRFYWEHNRTITDDLTNITHIPDQPHLKLEDIPNSLAPRKCLICRAFTYTVLNFYQHYNDIDLDEYLFDLCHISAKQQKYTCRGEVDAFLPAIKHILKHRANELSPDRICGILLQYNECSENKNLIDFEIESDHVAMEKAKVFEFNETATSILTVAHLSDFHYDPQYAAGSNSKCLDFVCCRNTSVASDNSTTHLAGYWGDYNSCDSPGYLVENICEQVATNHKNIDLVYYTGDFVDHFSWTGTVTSVKDSIAFVTQTMRKNFPNTPIVFVIGNHDIYPSDAFVASAAVDEAVSSKWLFEFVADLWSDWLPQASVKSLRENGYYTFVHRPGFRIIVLNNNLCFSFNIWLLYDSQDMITQLKWLRDTLIEAEAAGEKVHILGHVPPNTSSCTRAWNREYNKLIRQFAHIISGQFNGHTHNDEFTLFYATNKSDAAVNVAWNGGSGTSFVGLNSNYRLYQIETQTYQVVDHETWIFNLTQANQASHQTPNWFREYTFRDAFGVADLSPASLSTLVTKTFQNDTSLLRKLWMYRYKQADPKMAKGCDAQCLETIRLETNGDIEYNFFQ